MPATLQTIGEALEGRYRRHAREWLQRAATGAPFEVQSFGIAVAKKDAARDVAAYGAWEAQWQALADPGLRVVREPALWRELGRSERPVKLLVLSLKAAFSLMPDGRRLGKAFLTALQRAERLEGTGKGDIAAACLAEGRFLLEADDAEFERLTAVLSWLKDHERADCYIRELPVEGVDTKWLENNRALVARLMTSILGLTTPLAAADVARRWNLLSPPTLVRVRHAQALVSGLPAKVLVALPASILSAAAVPRVAVVENLQTGLALDVPEDVLIVTGMGAAVKALSLASWAKKARIVYMGDLDQHGLAILSELRRVLPQVQSVLMTPAALKRWRHLAVTDPTGRLKTPEAGLASEEEALFHALQGERLRLEQERLPIDAISRAFRTALDVAGRL